VRPGPGKGNGACASTEPLVWNEYEDEGENHYFDAIKKGAGDPLANTAQQALEAAGR